MLGFIKKYWLIILLAVLASTVAFVWFTKRSAPQKEVVIPPPPQPDSSFLYEGGSFTLEEALSQTPTLPSQLPVFSTRQFSKQTIESEFSILVKDLGFDSSPREDFGQDKTLLVWENKTSFLYIELPSGKIFFTGEAGIFLSSQNPVSQLQEKMALWKLTTTLREVSTEEMVVRGFESRPALRGETVDFIKITASPEIAGLLVSGAGLSSLLVEAHIDPRGNLLSFVFASHMPAAEQGVFPLFSLKEAVSLARSGQGKILKITDMEGLDASPLGQGALSSLKVEQVGLVYFESGEEQKMLQPVYVFSGTGKTASLEARRVQLLIPAVKN